MVSQNDMKSVQGIPGGSRFGLLFDQDYDAIAHARLAASGLTLDRAGFDIFRYPDKLRLLGFDFNRFAQRQARTAASRGWQGVVSHNELHGALAAALVAEQAGLPGTSPESVLACQHKLHARRVLDRVCPEANIPYRAVEVWGDHAALDEHDFPCHLKPVRAAFSVMARRLSSLQECHESLQLNPAERWIIGQILSPFDRIVAERLPQAEGSLLMIAEPIIHCAQHNLDGWVDSRGVHVLGVVDAVMVPGTQAFARWEFPGRLPEHVVARAGDIARAFLQEIGFSRGFFDMEFFYDPLTDRISVIEFNPRLSSQFGDLYRRVLGVDPHAMALSLAAGYDASCEASELPTARVAASLVWRAFSAAEVPPPPSPQRQEHFFQAFPDALLIAFHRRGPALARDFRWMGSHRYGVVNLGAEDAETLRQKSAAASALLGWPDAPYALPCAEAFPASSVWAAP